MKKSIFLQSLLKYAEDERNKWECGRVAPISPTPSDLISLVLDSLHLSTSDTVIDLGCGDGRWLYHIADRFSCHCWGVDMDTERISTATHRIKQGNIQTYLHLILADFSVCNLRYFTVVIVYLSRVGHIKMKDKLISECCPGTVVVSIGFQVKGWIPQETFRSSDSLVAYKYVI